MNNLGFDQGSWEQFNELATEKYGECKSGEKMTFGKCQKVGGSGGSSKVGDKKAKFEKDSAAQSKARHEKNLKKYPPNHKLHKQAKRALAKS